MKYSIVGLLLLWLSGCASLSEYSTYSVTQSEMESLLDNQLTELQDQARVAGIPATLAVDDMSVEIGPEGRDIVQLGAAATATIKAFGFSYPAKVNLQIEGLPYYDSDKKAIFLRSLKLLDSSIDAGGYKGNLAPVSGQVMNLINGYLSNQPVYELDTTNTAISVLSQIPLEMRIEAGRLTLRPRSQ